VLRTLGLRTTTRASTRTAAPSPWAIRWAHVGRAAGATRCVNQLQRTGGRYALCTMCIGVGQGIAADPRAGLSGGVSEADVKWARAGGTDRRFAALMERQHDATMLRAPFDLQAKNRGFQQLATAREVIGPYLGIVGAARRSWAQQNPTQVVAFIRAYRDAIRWLEAPANRGAAQALLMANVPGMSAQVAAQSCELMLHPRTGFFNDAGLDDAGVRAVLELRGRLGEPARRLTDPDKYIDRRYWREAMAR
jgi:ABC-type nitrate/sulfonate/bicarbonate transport system substrate-binding protein